MNLLGIIVISVYLVVGRYIETPSYVFHVYDNTTSYVKRAYLSPDGDQLMTFNSYLNNTSNTSQNIFYFNGTKACYQPYNYS